MAQKKNVGLAMVDLNRLNTNGPNHTYSLMDHRTLLWQPIWLNVNLSKSKKKATDDGEEEDEWTPAKMAEESKRNAERARQKEE